MTIHFYNHDFYNFLATKNDRLLAQNAITRSYVTYYKKLQTLTYLFRESLSGMIDPKALATCHVAHITKTLLVVSTPHTTIANHLKSLDSVILDELKSRHDSFLDIKQLHVSILEHEALKPTNS